MEKDILKNANFGDRFITRDGRKAIFVIAVYPIGYHCAVEEEDELIVYYSNGSHEGTRKSNIDIVGKEPIDKEQLKERAERKALGYNNSDVDKQDYYLGYCDGAVDQKKIDIDKACEWLSQCESLQMRPCDVELFRKAMKGIL